MEGEGNYYGLSAIASLSWTKIIVTLLIALFALSIIIIKSHGKVGNYDTSQRVVCVDT